MKRLSIKIFFLSFLIIISGMFVLSFSKKASALSTACSFDSSKQSSYFQPNPTGSGPGPTGAVINIPYNSEFYATQDAANELASCLGLGSSAVTLVDQSSPGAAYFIPSQYFITLPDGNQINAGYAITRYFGDISGPNGLQGIEMWSGEFGGTCKASGGGGVIEPIFYTAVGVAPGCPNPDVPPAQPDCSLTATCVDLHPNPNYDNTKCSWYSAWTSSGRNENGKVYSIGNTSLSIVDFIKNQPNQPDGVDPFTLATLTGKVIPYNGGSSALGVPGPWLAMAFPGGNMSFEDVRLFNPANYILVGTSVPLALSFPVTMYGGGNR